ncbi:MAG TPA: sulfatase-like hydrolase/transferase [Sedimentisphaerales bacterium]|nr:sulfatase-like hydrolase/transferase [Sedimentisphaerales bacterium]
MNKVQRKANKNIYTRRDYLKTLGLGVAGLFAPGISGCEVSKSTDSFECRSRCEWGKPNILFITTDYQRGVDGPSLGSPFLKMPALDRLCREGAVFSRHYSTSPICMPARYTWITGQYPHTHGQWDNHERWILDDSPVLMQLLKEQGYQTVAVGKMHFHPWDRMAGYDRRIIHEGKHNMVPDDYEKFLNARGHSRKEFLKNHGGGMAVCDWPWDESLHHDIFVGMHASGIIERDELEGPWFLWVSFPGPHNPWDPPARYSQPYKQMSLPLGNTFDGELLTKPIDHTRHRYGYGRPVFDEIDAHPEKRDEIIHAIRAGHYGNLTLIDDQLSAILEALEKKGQLDNTVIIYSSDHGSALGNHNLLHKGMHYDPQARVPFVVRYPKLVKPGIRRGFSSHVDLLPTIVSIAGGTVPSHVEGKDLTPMLKDASCSVNDFAIVECTLVTSIVTDRWKIGFHHFNGDGDLYDLDNDPNEFNNLFDNPEYADERKILAAKLVKWRRLLSPEMDIPEDPLRWRECLGPVVDLWRNNYMKGYIRMSKIEGRPGKVGMKYYNKYFGD